MVHDRANRTAGVLFAVAALAVISALVSAGTVGAQPSCGNVTYAEENGEHIVENVDQLQCISQEPMQNYSLGSDIDAYETENWNDGDGFEPIGFSGSLDGNGYVVSGLTIDRGDEEDVGLFGSLDIGATVENVGLEDANVTGGDTVGALVGWNGGEIESSYTTGKVTGQGERNVGGLAAENAGRGAINRSYSSAVVNGKGDLNVGGLVGRSVGSVQRSYATGSVRGGTNVGGLVGQNLDAVHESYALGNVEGRVTVGGLVGHNRGDSEIRESYSVGSVEGLESGGLVGLNDDRASVVDSYFDEERADASGRVETIGTGLTTEEMSGEDARRNMEGFDFSGTWSTDSGGYPVLTWQTTPAPEGDGEGETNDEREEDGGGTEDTEDMDDDRNEEGEANDESQNGGENGGEEDGEGDENGEGLPGMGVLPAVLALLCVGALLIRSG